MHLSATRPLGRTALLLCLAVPAAAEDRSADFPQLWGEYLELCGQAAADPEKHLAAAPNLPNEWQTFFLERADHNESSFEAGSPNRLRSGSYHLTRLDESYQLFCEVASFVAEGIDVQRTSDGIVGMLNATPQLGYSGGELTPTAGTEMTRDNAFVLPWYSVTVVGAFPTQNWGTRIDIQSEQMTITTHGNIIR
ncbi:MAG: hypothetical protein WBB25_04050 [Sulfitobacter sp.]